MVDNSGYSSGLRQKYQAYLLTEVPLLIDGQSVKPGAYGFGSSSKATSSFSSSWRQRTLQASSQRDADIKRPTTLSIGHCSEARNIAFTWAANS